MSFPLTKLAEVTEKIGSGVTPRGGDSVYVQDGTSLIRSQNVYNSQFTNDGLVHIDEKTATKMKGVTVFKDDVLLNITGDSVARCCKVDERYLPARVNQHVAIVRADKSKLNPDFLMFYLTSPYMQTKMLSWAGSGGTRKALTKGMIEGFEVPTPDIDVQLEISGILKNYNDLIENNKRRIELLEESARQLYKEWFVRFRFPGHEHVKIIDGVPEGWQRLKISDLCTVGRGASPRPIQDYMDGEIPWFKIADATASESPFIFETREKVIESGAQKSVYLLEGELILSNSATCGVPNFTGVKGCIHDGWLYFKGLKVVDKWFLYLYLVFQQRALLQGIGEGATQKNLNTTYVGNQVVTIPGSDTLLQSFTDLVEPVFMQIKTLAIYNRQLSQARDFLLPKLMKGEIAV